MEQQIQQIKLTDIPNFPDLTLILHFTKKQKLIKIDFESADALNQKQESLVKTSQVACMDKSNNRVIEVIQQYFLNKTDPIFDDLGILYPKQTTTFQQKVLNVVSLIPIGEVWTYRQIAEKLKTRGYQAIGSALRRNPFPILIPCHRVKSEKNMGGFMGQTDPESWEMALKIHLLDWEKRKP